MTQINFQYGGIGQKHNSFGGLESEFLTNSAGVSLPLQYYQQIISDIYQGFSVATNYWSLGETHHEDTGQTFLYIIYGHHVTLYWNSNLNCGHLTEEVED